MRGRGNKRLSAAGRTSSVERRPEGETIEPVPLVFPALLKRAIEIDAAYAMAYRELGRATYCSLDDTPEATRLLRKWLSFEEADAITHDYLAIILHDEYHLDQEAESHWLRCIELDPTWAVPHWRLGTLYQSIKRLAEAERMLRRAVELDGNDVDAREHLGWLLLDSGRPQEARAHFRQALELKPESDQAQHIERLLRLADGFVDDAGTP